MPWDIAISDAGDFIWSAHHDLAGISGTDQIEQRMIVRLKIPRGSWIYDGDGTLGSLLYRLQRESPDRAQAVAEAYVRDALRPISEITIDGVDVGVNTTAKAITVIVHYHTVQTTEGITVVGEERQLVISTASDVGGGS